MASSDLKVSVTAADGTETLLQLGVGYTVTGGNGSTGNVVTLQAQNNTKTVTIWRETALTQGLSYQPNDSFPAASHEQALDRLTYMVQDLSREKGQGIRLANSQDPLSALLPENDTVIGFSSSGVFGLLPKADFIGPTGPVGQTGSAGANGTNGSDGNDGWTPVFSVASDGSRRVLRVTDWTGGEGPKPATGKYVGPSGLVTLASDGVDIRGAAGANGTNGTNGANGATGPAGPTGAPGAPGVTSAQVDSTTTGAASVIVSLNAGVLAFDFIVPRGPTGPAGPSGGPAGPTGPAGGPGATGPTGPAGPTGPKGSFVSVESGIYELACAEATRPWFFHIRKTDEEIPRAFLETICGDVLRFPSHDGRHELCFGVRREFPEWFMPRSTPEQMRHSVAWWNQEYLSKEERGDA